MPKKVKHRKWHKMNTRGNRRALDTRGLEVNFGYYGLKALEGSRLNSRQIEAARRTITNFIKREGRLYIRVFPDQPVTKQAPEKTLGGGKGSVDHYVVNVKPGRIIFELDTSDPQTAREALRLAGFKLPFKTKVVERTH